ncbi:MAG TPA: hypothetical protein PKW49_10525 [Paludibacteraceae bacterium]|nr:hypothetical protein [Paludibacteraceae bacterium]HQF50793.1 hypothetical protein [Paludibacteraceae bacterium]HQJ90473.1 hypothetical protein [Paludibacteraceae bacterium]
MKTTVIYISFLLIFITQAMGQENISTNREAVIAQLFDSIQSTDNDSAKHIFSQKIETLFAEELQEPGSFDHPFESLRYIGKVTSDDNKVRVYTWNYPLSDKTYGYGGFIQYRLSSKKQVVTPLQTPKQAYLPPTNKRIANTEWYGALYYKAIHVRKGDYYVLLGWAGKDMASDFKLVESMEFDNKGKAKFGKLAFKGKRQTVHRYILEYSAEAKVSLSYDEKNKRIAFDHLVPTEPIYENIFSYYGPDFTYDALYLKKGKWHLEENIDIKNQ